MGSSRFMSMKKAVCLLQTAIRAWLFVKLDSLPNQFGASKAQKLSCGMCCSWQPPNVYFSFSGISASYLSCLLIKYMQLK